MKQSKRNDFGDARADVQDNLIAYLDGELQSIKDKRLEERFYFLVAIILLLDVCLLVECHWIFISFACIVETVIILALSEKMGVESVGRWTRHFSALTMAHFQAKINQIKNISKS